MMAACWLAVTCDELKDLAAIETPRASRGAICGQLEAGQRRTHARDGKPDDVRADGTVRIVGVG